jgi:hypothetical protein
LPQPAPITASATSINASNCGESDGGLIIINPSGGAGNYQYQIAGGYWQSNPTVSGLSTGYYAIGIRDMNNCYGQVNDAYVGNNKTAITFNASSQDISSCGGIDGGITISGVNGGIGVYQ